jgi:hypothetical protein
MAEALSKSIWNFDPRSIPGCCMWIDPADDSTLTRTGSSVSAIRDKFTNSTSTWAITGTLPTIGAVTLNGSNMLTIPVDCRISTNVVVSNAYRTWFMVAQIDNSSIPVTSPNTYQFLTGATAGNSFSIGYWHGTASILMGRSGLNAMEVPASNLTSGFFNSSFLLATSHAPTIAEGRGIFLNGTSLGLSTNTAYTMGTGTVNQVINGAGGNQRSYRLGEMLLYDNPLQAVYRQQIEGYLAHKWGLTSTLPVTHPYRSIRPYARTFQPNDLSGCILWLDCADIGAMTLSGSNVSQLNDKSGLANHAVQTTSSNQPVLVQNVRNGNSVIRFSGPGGFNRLDTRYLSNVPMAFPNAPYTVYAVAQAVSNAASSAYGYNFIFKPHLADDWRFMCGSRSNDFTTFAGTSSGWYDTAAISGTQPVSNWTMMSIVNRGTTGGLLPYINGNARTAKTGGPTATAVGYTLGDADANAHRGQNWNGDIGELIVFNRDLSSADGNLIEGYLAAKWGLTGNLPSIHPYSGNRLTPTTIPFQPNQLSSLLAWYDAADPAMIDLSGTGVRTWYDKSGRGYHATPNTVLASYDRTNPANYFNSNMVLRWQNYGYYNIGGLVLAPSKSCHIVHVGITQGDVTRNKTLFMAPDYRDAVFFIRDTPAHLVWGMGGAGNYAQTDTLITASNYPLIAAVDVSQGGTAVSTIYFNGSSIGTLTRTTNTLDVSRQYQINRDVLSGLVGEVLLFSNSLGTQDRQRVEGYLAHKWKLTSYLPAGHPYKSTRP